MIHKSGVIVRPLLPATRQPDASSLFWRNHLLFELRLTRRPHRFRRANRPVEIVEEGGSVLRSHVNDLVMQSPSSSSEE